MFRNINKIGQSLSKMGIKKGDVVAICMPNTPEAIEMFYAINEKNLMYFTNLQNFNI